MFAVGTSVVLLDVAESVTVAESSSPMVKLIAPVLVFASMVRSAMLQIVGASFTAVTVMVTVATLVSIDAVVGLVGERVRAAE